MPTGSLVLSTPRLTLSELTADDADFVVELLNDPAFIRYIGDRGVRTPDDARAYVARGPAASYAEFGFGLWLVALKDGGRPLGMCGLLKRPVLEDVDIGFALLPQFRCGGYGYEAAAAVVAYARDTLRLPRLVAIANSDNAASARLLEKLGLSFERMVKIDEAEPALKLFSITWASA